MAKKTELELAAQKLKEAEDAVVEARKSYQEAHEKSLKEKPQMSLMEIRAMIQKTGVKSDAQEKAKEA